MDNNNPVKKIYQEYHKNVVDIENILNNFLIELKFYITEI